jgi:thiamine-monophosphate kinase
VKLREIGEFGLNARIKNSWSASSPQVIKGEGYDLASTVHLLIEDVHFDLSFIDPYPLDRKSLAVNLSDLAAMGATPRCDST